MPTIEFGKFYVAYCVLRFQNEYTSNRINLAAYNRENYLNYLAGQNRRALNHIN